MTLKALRTRSSICYVCFIEARRSGTDFHLKQFWAYNKFGEHRISCRLIMAPTNFVSMYLGVFRV